MVSLHIETARFKSPGQKMNFAFSEHPIIELLGQLKRQCSEQNSYEKVTFFKLVFLASLDCFL